MNFDEMDPLTKFAWILCTIKFLKSIFNDEEIEYEAKEM